MDSLLSRSSILVLLSLLPTLSMSLGAGKLYSVDVALIPLVFLFFFLAALKPEEFSLRVRWLDVLGIGLLGSVIVSSILSFKPMQSLEVCLDWIRVMTVYLLGRFLFQRSRDAGGFVSTLKIVAAILLFVGGIQAITGTQFGLVGNLVGENRDQQMQLRLNAEDVAMRVSGPTSNPNIYGLWVILFGGFWLTDLLWRRKYVLFLLLGSVMLGILLRTFSRGILATFLVFLAAVFSLLLWRSRRHLLPVVGLVVAITITASCGVLVAVSQGDVPETVELLKERFWANNDSVRVLMIRVGWTFLDSPKLWLLGMGPGVFHAYAYSEGYNLGPKPWQDYSTSTSGIHNVFFKLLIEYGAVTLLFFLAGVGSLLFRLRFLYRRGGPQGTLWGIYGFSLAIAFGLVSAQVYEGPISYQIMIPCAMIAAFVLSAEDLEGRSLEGQSAG